MATPYHKNPCPLGHETYNFGRHQYINFTLFTPKLPPLGVGGPEIYNFLSAYPTDATYQIWLRLAQ